MYYSNYILFFKNNLSLSLSLIIIKKHFIMANKLNYDSKEILNIKFSPKEKGYDPDEVDAIFDNIISDYETLTAQIIEANNKIAKQQAKSDEQKKDIERLTFELASLRTKYDLLKKTSKVTDDNYDLVLKVAAYERVLHRKGINLKKALSDPDNC